MRASATSVVLGLLLAAAVCPATSAPIIADHHAADAFDAIPASYFQSVRDHFRIFYGRTSHGSQVEAGIGLLVEQDPVLHAGPAIDGYGVDLGYYGDTTWVTFTRDYLSTHPECNAVLWAWCSGLTVSSLEDTEVYLQAMNRLESEYPGVLFVYMTGHLDGTGTDGQLAQNNDRIRAWCATNDKVLFDFADIESYDPDGLYYPDDRETCEWCFDWCATHDCPECADCAHSHCFNCYRKGRAFWWMMARARGWLPADIAGGAGDLGFTAPAHPNPFGTATKLAFTLAEPGAMRLEIVDIAGRSVATLVDSWMTAGRHEFNWNGRNASGEPAPAGVYFARFTGPRSDHTGSAPGQRVTRTERLVLLR